MPSNHLILCHPLLLLSPIPPSIRVFSNESTLSIRWPNIGVSASTQVLPMNTQGRTDLLYDGLVGPPRSPRDSQESSPKPQFKSINSSAFFTVQLSHPYMTTGKTIALTFLIASVVSDSVWPHRWQPTRLPHPWDSLGKNTGVGCHFLLQCMKVKSESEVAQSSLTLRDPMDFSLPGSPPMGFSRQEYWSGLPLPSP